MSAVHLIYSALNFTEGESVADIEYGSIDHSSGCVLSAGLAPGRQQASGHSSRRRMKEREPTL